MRPGPRPGGPGFGSGLSLAICIILNTKIVFFLYSVPMSSDSFLLSPNHIIEKTRFLEMSDRMFVCIKNLTFRNLFLVLNMR